VISASSIDPGTPSARGSNGLLQRLRGSVGEVMQTLLDRPGFSTKRGRLLELLRTRAFQEREVVLSSGLKSNFYIDCKQVSLDAEGAALIGELFHLVIEEIAPRAVARRWPDDGGGSARDRDVAAVVPARASARRVPGPQGAQGPWHEPVGREHEAPARRTGGDSRRRDHDRRLDAAGGRAIARGRLEVLCAVGLVDRLEGGREAVVAETPLTTLFTRRDFLPDQ